jgi:hypothetical protein
MTLYLKDPTDRLNGLIISSLLRTLLLHEFALMMDDVYCLILINCLIV